LAVSSDPFKLKKYFDKRPAGETDDSSPYVSAFSFSDPF